MVDASEPANGGGLLSVVVPVRDEEATLPVFYPSLRDVLEETGCEWEILFVDDGSSDGTSRQLQSMREQEPRIGVLELSRNFGKEVAISAGLEHATGDAVVVIDADMQDPPALIHEFLHYWRQGYDVVYGKRVRRDGDSLPKRYSARIFYWLLNRLSDVPIPRDVGDYRLLSRRSVEAIRALPERHRYMKGLYAWVGFPQKAIAYERVARVSGRSKWGYWRLWNFAIEGITSFSTAPLRLATYLGLLTSGFSFVYGLYMLVRTLIWGNPVPGYPSLIIIVLFLGGIQLICLGIIGEYLGRTYQESKGRALYFVQSYHPARNPDCDD